MRRRIRASRLLDTDGQSADTLFSADPAVWLPDPARPRGPGCWTVGLAAGPATRWVACRVGGVWRTAGGVWRSVQWQPESEREDLAPVRRGLPTFRGELGLVEHGDRSDLVLRGSYQPPGGWLGAVADAAALRNVAAATAQRFLDDVGRRLSQDAVMGAGERGDA